MSERWGESEFGSLQNSNHLWKPPLTDPNTNICSGWILRGTWNPYARMPWAEEFLPITDVLRKQTFCHRHPGFGADVQRPNLKLYLQKKWCDFVSPVRCHEAMGHGEVQSGVSLEFIIANIRAHPQVIIQERSNRLEGITIAVTIFVST